MAASIPRRAAGPNAGNTTRLWNFTLPIGDALDIQMTFPKLDPMVL